MTSTTTITDTDLLNLWRTENDAGNGEEAGEEGQTPAEAAAAERYTDIREIDPEGAVVCYRTDRRGERHTIVVADAEGPWACEVPVGALEAVRETLTADEKEQLAHELRELAEDSRRVANRPEEFWCGDLEEFDWQDAKGDGGFLAWLYSMNVATADWSAIDNAYEAIRAERWDARKAPGSHPLAEALVQVLEFADSICEQIHREAAEEAVNEVSEYYDGAVEAVRSEAMDSPDDAATLLCALSRGWEPSIVIDGVAYHARADLDEDGDMPLYRAHSWVVCASPDYWLSTNGGDPCELVRGGSSGPSLREMSDVEWVRPLSCCAAFIRDAEGRDAE